jgi:hypothetical protein
MKIKNKWEDNQKYLIGGINGKKITLIKKHKK